MFYIYNLKRIYYRANGHTCYLLLRTYNSAPIAFAFVEPTGGETLPIIFSLQYLDNNQVFCFA